MFVKIKVEEISTGREYVEIGEFVSLYYDEDTDCAVLSLKDLNDIYIPCSLVPFGYDILCDKIFRCIQHSVEAVEIIAPALDVEDSFFETIDEYSNLVTVFANAAPSISGEACVTFL